MKKGEPRVETLYRNSRLRSRGRHEKKDLPSVSLQCRSWNLLICQSFYGEKIEIKIKNQSKLSLFYWFSSTGKEPPFCWFPFSSLSLSKSILTPPFSLSTFSRYSPFLIPLATSPHHTFLVYGRKLLFKKMLPSHSHPLISSNFNRPFFSPFYHSSSIMG